jgi:hypothetical protein
MKKAFIHSLKEKIQLVLAQYGPTAHRIVKICKDLNIPLITIFMGMILLRGNKKM